MKYLYNLILEFDYFAPHVFLYRALRLMELKYHSFQKLDLLHLR